MLVTGAGGSIGSELCRQIVQLSPSTLLLVELSEYALYGIHQELEQLAPTVRVIPLLASVCDAARLREVMRAWRPDTVYHAAAYKHVPLVEHNPAEGVRNNAMGTLTTARIAMECKVPNFVLISTDKAVRPTNIMGASKRVAEMALQGLAQQSSDTCFSMVRFGNVLGSSGSVVPLFRKQIEAGGPITLTHADITRYFMTIPEAAQLVIQAGAMAQGGDVFVLDMGEPVRIIDLARRLVELSGRTVRDEHSPDGDIELQVTGLRPGEKLYEELLIGDSAMPTAHPRVMKAHEPCLPWNELWRQFEKLNTALESSDVPMLKRTLTQMLPGYRPHAEVVDWVHMERHRVRDRALPIAAAVGAAQVGGANQPSAPNRIAVAI
ncbi:UDP-N-acetyl-alpha-D-glucosamine C6 dehydratase [compost metagenome]